MDRRKLLKLSGLAGGIVTFPGLLGFETIKHAGNKLINQGHIYMKLGEIDVFLFSDGHISLKSPQPIFAPGINSIEVKEELKKLYLDEDKLDAAINVMLIRYGNKSILIDTGSGHHFGDAGGQLLNNLRKAAIKATDITDVFITHGHIDHIGGIITENGKLRYPNAQYHIAKEEYKFWMENPDFSKSKDLQSPQASIDLAQQVLNSIKDRLTLFNQNDVLFSCVKTELAEGHTPGHTIFTLFSGGKSIKHVVDTFHTPLLIAQPNWGSQWDVNFANAVHTRKQILENSYHNRTLLMTTHLPWPGLGYIGKNNNAYQWIPLSYFTPNEIIL